MILKNDIRAWVVGLPRQDFMHPFRSSNDDEDEMCHQTYPAAAEDVEGGPELSWMHCI